MRLLRVEMVNDKAHCGLFDFIVAAFLESGGEN